MSQSLQQSIAGLVPAYNSGSTVGEAVESIRSQNGLPMEVLVVDDASSDNTKIAAETAGARVVSLPVNSGRGAVRAKGIELLKADFIVSVDSGNRISPDFVACAMPLFEDPQVVAVVGNWWEPETGILSQRWRARHLFKIGRQATHGKPCHLSTHGCILRRSAIIAAGNFDLTLRHSEDAQLGWILTSQGYRILACPESKVVPLRIDSIPQLMRRYWRWHAGIRERWSLKRYVHHIKNSVMIMTPLDWRARDFTSLMLTLALPHWIALYSLKRKLGWKSKI